MTEKNFTSKITYAHWGIQKAEKFNLEMQFKKLPHTFGIILHLNTQKSKYSHVWDSFELILPTKTKRINIHSKNEMKTAGGTSLD